VRRAVNASLRTVTLDLTRGQRCCGLPLAKTPALAACFPAAACVKLHGGRDAAKWGGEAQLLACTEGSWPGIKELDINQGMKMEEPSELLAALVRLCPRLEAVSAPLAPASLRALAPAARSLKRLAVEPVWHVFRPGLLDSASDSDSGSDIEEWPPSELEGRPTAATAAAAKDGAEGGCKQLKPRAGVCAALAALTGLTELRFDVCGQGWDWEVGANPSRAPSSIAHANALCGMLEALPRLPRLAVLRVPLVEDITAAPLGACPALRELEVVVHGGHGTLGDALLRVGVAPGVRRLRGVGDG
jgi:hypothetical protein